MIEITKYNSSLKKEWDEFVSRAKNSHFLFYRDYMEYHSDRFKDHSLLFYKKNKLMAVLPANEKENKLFSHAGLTFGGILSTSKMTIEVMLEIFENLISYMKKNNFSELIYKAIPHIYHQMPAEEDLYALFYYDAVLYRRDFSSTVYQENKVRYHHGRKNVINKAKLYNLSIKRSYDYETFMELVAYRLKKRHEAKPVHTAEEIKLLASRFPDNIKLFVAEKPDGEMVGGVIIYETQTVAHGQYMGFSDEGEELRVIDLIHDYLLNEYYANKKYFDFGTSTLKEGKYLNKGVARYKESFGARGIVYDFYKLSVK